jgi:hypothetical protein
MAKRLAQWTVMVYMAGDNNLSEASTRDLIELASVASHPSVNVLVQHDTAGDGPTLVYHLQAKAGLPKPIRDLGETDSGDPVTLYRFLRWAQENFPARQYALILWGHGTSWQPADISKIAQSTGAGAIPADEAAAHATSNLANAMFRPTVQAVLSSPTQDERAVCADDGTGNAIDATELKTVLAKAMRYFGKPLDILGLDACLMCNIELAYELKDCVRYMIGSEEIVPNSGWPYDRILRKLMDKPNMLAEELARHIPQQYVKRYVRWGYPEPVTLTAMDLKLIDRVTGSLDQLATALIAHMPQAAYEIFDSQKDSTYFWRATLWDIGHLCEVLQLRTASKDVREAAGRVRAALSPGIDSFVVEQRSSGHKVGQCNGLTIYLRPYRKEISRAYDTLAFTRQVRWLEMMRAYHAAG